MVATWTTHGPCSRMLQRVFCSVGLSAGSSVQFRVSRSGAHLSSVSSAEIFCCQSCFAPVVGCARALLFLSCAVRWRSHSCQGHLAVLQVSFNIRLSSFEK